MARCEQLEPRELLSTVQNFTTPGTSYTLQQIGGPPAAMVPTGANFLRLATLPQSSAAGNNNSISFATSDPGTFGEVTADWDFRVTPNPITSGGTGQGMSFGLLNTSDYGTSGPAASVLPQNGLYNGSLGFGFDTQTDTVYLSSGISGPPAIVTAVNLTGRLNLVSVSGLFIHAAAVINFQTSTVSLTLTPSGGSAVPVFPSTPVMGLSPYESRVSFQALNSPTLPSYADFDLTNINVRFLSALSPGTIAFSSSSYAANQNQGLAPIELVRQLPPGTSASGSESVVVVPADGTAKNGTNYLAEIVDASGAPLIDPAGDRGVVTFSTTDTSKTVYVPILNNHLYGGNKTVNLYISNYIPSNPTFSAPLSRPITATLTIAVPPTVSSHVSLVYVPHTRKVKGFRLQFSQAMDPTSSQNLANYDVLLQPARKKGRAQVVPLSQAVLDPTGQFVTLTRANVSQHLTNRVHIIVHGQPPRGLLSAFGISLAGTPGVSGTDASLTVSI